MIYIICCLYCMKAIKCLYPFIHHILYNIQVGGQNALMVLKERHASLRSFLEKYFSYFTVRVVPFDSQFIISLKEVGGYSILYIL